MKAFILATASLLSGCMVYRVAPENIEAFKSANLAHDVPVEVVKQNEFPRGFQCFEPMLFALTVGIIPVHCVDTYTASISKNGESVSGTYTVTTMQGWFPLLLLPFPSWHYGNGQHPEPMIESMVKGSTQ